MKLPNESHPIRIVAQGRRIRVHFNGHIVADTTCALTLSEATYADVHYIPRAHVNMAYFVRTAHSSYCPYKGEAAYYSLVAADRRTSENAVWTYESPYPAVVGIKDHLAFYPRRVDRIEEAEA